MSEHKWIGFDLDGTLHDMGRVQTLTESGVFDDMAWHTGISPVELRSTYRIVNRDNLSVDIFANGWNADKHRTLRLQTLLDHFGLAHNGHMDRWLNLYRRGYEDNLELFPGVMDMLDTLRAHRYQIAIITERPHDSAEHAIEHLGLGPYVDLLTTVGGEKTSKPDGLFARALDQMNAANSPVPLIGDKLDRDIRPALAAGMQAIWYVHPAEMPQALPHDLPDTVSMVNDHADILSFIE